MESFFTEITQCLYIMSLLAEKHKCEILLSLITFLLQTLLASFFVNTPANKKRREIFFFSRKIHIYCII